MKEKKYYIALDDFERRIVVNCMNEMRNKLIADGKYTDALDEVLLKIIHSKQKKLNPNYESNDFSVVIFCVWTKKSKLTKFL